MAQTFIERAASAALIFIGIAMISPSQAEINFRRSTLTIETRSGQLAFDVEIADDDVKRERGLMFRQTLGEKKGMIFLFDRPEIITMWMKNTYIPLDMVFIGADWRISNIATDAEPHSTAIISSGSPALRVLEIGGGEAKRLGLTVGDRVLFSK